MLGMIRRRVKLGRREISSDSVADSRGLQQLRRKCLECPGRLIVGEKSPISLKFPPPPWKDG